MSVKQVEKIERLKKRLINWTEEYGKDHSMVMITKWDIEELEDNIEDENFINSFSKRISKSVRLMKKIHDADLDEQVPDNKDIEKVKSLINKEVTELELKMRELKNLLSIANNLNDWTRYDNPNQWYSVMKRIYGED